MENQKLSAYDSSSIVTTENKEELQEDVTGVGESDIYNQAQKAMYNSEVNLQKSASMRKELQQYVDSVSNMLDSEGKPLVQIPANFATIVESMNRQDVVSTEERPWIKYLLAETFDKQLEKEFEGRYRTVVSTQEESIQRGLAKINLLDRQLKEIESKSSSPRSSRLQAGRVANNFTQGGADFPDRDETFITKIRSEGRLSRKKERDGEDSQQTTAREEEELKEEEQQFNKASHRDLSMEDEKKLAALLELDDNQFADMNKYYGDSEDFINARTAIDEKLEKYGRMERIRSRASSANTNGVPETKRGRSEDVKGSAPDYLTQQRLERAEREAARNLERLISRCKNEGVDYTEMLQITGPLLLNGADEEFSFSDDETDTVAIPKDHKESLIDVPEVSNLRMERRVTQNDIAQLLKEIAAEELLKSGNFHGVSSPGKESMSARSLTSLSVADKSVIAQLINSYKTEVHKLSKLRAEHRRLSQLRNSSEVLNVNHNSSNNNAVDTIDYVPKEKVLTTATSSSLPNETPIEKWRRERDIRAKKKQEMIERSKDAAAIASTPAVTEDENINNSTELNDDGDEELDSEWEYENGDIYDLVDQTSHYPVENVSYTAIAAKTSNLVSKVSKLVSGGSEPPPFPENNASKSTEDVNSHSSDVDYPPKVEATITEEEKRFLQEAIRQDIRNSFGLRGGIRNNAPSRTISTDSTSHHRGGNAILENHSNEVRTSLRSSGDGYSNSRSNSRGNNAPGQRQGIALAIMENNVRNILDQGSMNI